jgi:hypothetical protein
MASHLAESLRCEEKEIDSLFVVKRLSAWSMSHLAYCVAYHVYFTLSRGKPYPNPSPDLSAFIKNDVIANDRHTEFILIEGNEGIRSLCQHS